MGISFVFLAAADARNDLLTAPPRGFRLDVTDTLLVLGVVLVLAALLFFWAFYIRKRPTQKNGTPSLVKPSRRHEHVEHGEDGDSRRRVKIRKRRRRHHPDNFPRNPTLGETGGLPPVRSEEPQPPPQ